MRPHFISAALCLLVSAVMNVIAVAAPSRAATSARMETYTIVNVGNNAPEALLRTIRVKSIIAGKKQIEFAAGPCFNQSKTRQTSIVLTNERISTNDLFYIVSLSLNPEVPAKWALRRASRADRERYESCKWQ